MQVLFLSMCLSVCLNHFTWHFTSFRYSQTVLATETSRALHISCNVWQTAGETDALVVHSSTILMCHLISNHIVLLQKGKKRGESARIGWYGRYRERMETGEERRGGGAEGKKSLSQQKFSLKFWDKWSLCPSPEAAWGVMLFLCK